MQTAPGPAAQETVRPDGATGTGTAAGFNGKRGLIDLARIAMEDVVRLVQQEIQLAKIEIREMLISNVKAAILLGAAAFCALLFLVLGLVTVALLIEPHALVGAIETAVFLVLAIVLALLGKSMLKVGPPPRTMTTLKEDAEWAKHLLKRNGK